MSDFRNLNPLLSGHNHGPHLALSSGNDGEFRAVETRGLEGRWSVVMKIQYPILPRGMKNDIMKR